MYGFKPPLKSKYGLTVKQLKEYIADLPDIQENGEENYVWIGDAGNLSNVAYSIWCLGGGEISIEFKGHFQDDCHSSP